MLEAPERLFAGSCPPTQRQSKTGGKTTTTSTSEAVSSLFQIIAEERQPSFPPAKLRTWTPRCATQKTAYVEELMKLKKAACYHRHFWRY
jgi:hypothetical protein